MLVFWVASPSTLRLTPGSALRIAMLFQAIPRICPTPTLSGKPYLYKNSRCMKQKQHLPPVAHISTLCHHWLALPDEVTDPIYTDHWPPAHETTPSYSFRKGDLVLIRFPFQERQGMKLRPTLVLAATPDILTVCFMTTQLEPQDTVDVLLHPDMTNGLDRDTLIKTSRLASLQRNMAVKRIGRIGEVAMQELNLKLMRWLDLP